MMMVLAEREFPIDEIAAVASSRSHGSEVEFGDTGKMLKCQNIEHFDWSGWDIALFAAGSGPAKDYAPKAAAAGCIVIDNSSLYRMDPDVPLIVPEVNPDAIDGYTAKNIIANPNCSTAQLVVALKPLHDAAGIKRVVVSTYQSVSGAGKEGMDELFQQSRAIFVGDPVEPAKFTKQIAFNVIPHIDVFLDDGSTKEEWKMVVETKKILDPKIKLTATCVRVPVFVGHSGVGKSTLVNALVPEAGRATGHVNQVTGRGRHTSSSTVSLRYRGAAGNGWVIDTPGVRSFGLGHVEAGAEMALALGRDDGDSDRRVVAHLAPDQQR